MLNVQNTPISGLLMIEPEATHDLRGTTRPVFHPTEYAAFGMTGRFNSDRYVRSFQGTLRGLYLLPADQHMLLNVIRGDITVVVADIRENSRQFGTWQMIDINEAQNRQLYISGGLAYATLARSEIVDMHEKYTGFYNAGDIRGLFWKDASLDINWPIKFPLVSDEEARFQTMKELTGVCV